MLCRWVQVRKVNAYSLNPLLYYILIEKYVRFILKNMHSDDCNHTQRWFICCAAFVVENNKYQQVSKPGENNEIKK